MSKSIEKKAKKPPLLSKEQWAEAEERCTLFSSAKLLADGRYQLSLMEYRWKNKVVVQLYVNGNLKGAWFLCKPGEEPAPELKYYYSKEGYVYGKNMRKVLAAMKSKDADKKKPQYQTYFSSFSQARRHLESVCETLELITD